MASKSPQAFRTIREVADWLGIEAHVLRFWESKFNQIKPVKRAGGRRYYRPADMRLVGGIKILLHDQGLTIRGVQKLIREEGVGHVAAMSPDLDEDILDGELIEAATPAPAAPPAQEDAGAGAKPDGFFDVDAMAGSADKGAEPAAPSDDASAPTADPTPTPPPEPAPEAAPEPALAAPAPPPEAAPEPAPAEPDPALSPAAQDAADAPADTTPEPEQPAPAGQPAPTQAPAAPPQPSAADAPALTALHQLVASAPPLSATQVAALAPHVARLQDLADRLTARSRAS